MNSALVIVHADEPYLDLYNKENTIETKIQQIYFKNFLYKKIKESLNKKKIYFIATEKNRIPGYLSEFSSYIKLIEDNLSLCQVIKCKDLLLRNKYNEVELGGLFYDRYIYTFYIGLKGILKSESFNRLGKINFNKIKLKKNC